MSLLSQLVPGSVRLWHLVSVSQKFSQSAHQLFDEMSSGESFSRSFSSHSCFTWLTHKPVNICSEQSVDCSIWSGIRALSMSFCYPSSPGKLAMKVAFFASGAALFAVGMHLSYLNVAPQQARTKARNDFVKERLRQKQGKWFFKIQVNVPEHKHSLVFLLSAFPTLYMYSHLFAL